jgi:hypothetical protein
MSVRRARVDPSLEARLEWVAPLRYTSGASEADDRPEYVRAASSVRRVGDRLVIMQDDVNILVLRSPDGEDAPILLPVGFDGRRVFDEERGTKRYKLDLEAGAVLPDGRLVAFGSGSTPAREQLVVLTPAGEVRLVPASALYAGLRAETRFSGSELNVEGALVVGDVLRLFQRGNGAPRDGLLPVNAIGDLALGAFCDWLDGAAAAPALDAVAQFDLGQIGGARFGFTDATLTADGRVAFIACAEDSPDAVRDGENLGARFGILDGDRVLVTDVLDPTGEPSRLKLEGIEARPDDPERFDVVIDADQPHEPALIGLLRVRGRPTARPSPPGSAR